MMAAKLLDDLSRYGADVILDGGQLKIGIRHGHEVPEEVINKAKKHKAELIAALESENYAECISEREAIMLESGELSQEEVQQQAKVICMDEWRQMRR